MGLGGLAPHHPVPTSVPSAFLQTWGPAAPQTGGFPHPLKWNPHSGSSTDPLSRRALGAGRSVLAGQALRKEAEGGLEGPHGEDRPPRAHFPN